MYALSTAHGSPLIWATLLSFVFEMRDAIFPISLGSTVETILNDHRKKLPKIEIASKLPTGQKSNERCTTYCV